MSPVSPSVTKLVTVRPEVVPDQPTGRVFTKKKVESTESKAPSTFIMQKLCLISGRKSAFGNARHVWIGRPAAIVMGSAK
jgi:hypothetical protein